jgi:tRNA pseudouridine38-40 synthase
MRQMVRSIAGTLIRVGIGRMAVSDVGDILESRTRTEAADTAAAHGLYLVDVRYAPATTSGKNISGGVEARRIEETV